MRFSVRKQRQLPGPALAVAAIFCLAVGIFWTVDVHLKPTLLAIAEAKANPFNS
jgi:hypothetical protein